MLPFLSFGVPFGDNIPGASRVVIRKITPKFRVSNFQEEIRFLYRFSKIHSEILRGDIADLK
jgi:hypothetical protein